LDFIHASPLLHLQRRRFEHRGCRFLSLSDRIEVA